MLAKKKEYLHIGLQDALPFAQKYASDNNDLLIIDDFSHLDIENKVLQTSFFTLAYCEGGEGKFRLNGRPVQLRRGDLLVLFGQQVIDSVERSDDFRLVGILQSLQYVQETIMSMLHLWPYLLYLMDNPVLSLTPDEQRWTRHLYLLLLRRLAEREDGFLRESLQAMLQVFYFDVCRFLERRCPQRERSSSRSSHVFFLFMEQLSAHYMREREVAWYADRLTLTPKYLSEVVKQVSGRTVSQWISTMVVMEIKSRLRNTDESIKEIAVALNFPNQSFLGKYFKNLTGMSPLEFRKRQ